MTMKLLRILQVKILIKQTKIIQVTKTDNDKKFKTINNSTSDSNNIIDFIYKFTTNQYKPIANQK